MLLASIFAGACTFKTFSSPKAVNRVEDLLCTGVVFGKACLCMSLYVWVRDWWSLAERCDNHRDFASTPYPLPQWFAEIWAVHCLSIIRLLYTYMALLGVPWVLLLDYWNLIMWKY
eukprot:COSAG02_NODE_1243_length_13681_cov_55.123767_3_plen_116_part_00